MFVRGNCLADSTYVTVVSFVVMSGPAEDFYYIMEIGMQIC